jgi:hypothetical protein
MQQLLFEVRFRPEADMGQPGLFSSHSPAQKIVPMDASFYVVGLATLALRSRFGQRIARKWPKTNLLKPQPILISLGAA